MLNHLRILVLFLATVCAAAPVMTVEDASSCISGRMGPRLDGWQSSQAIECASRDPVRAVDGQAVDLSRVFSYYAARNPLENPLPEWAVIVGQIKITSEGMLVATSELHGIRHSEPTVYLMGHPHHGQLVDGQYITCFARLNGRKRYQDAFGAAHTVQLWEYGEQATAAQIDAVMATWDAAKRAKEQKREQRIAELRAAYSQRQKTRQQRELEDLRRSAEGGAGWAQYSLGLRHLEGRGVESNRAEALRWLQSATTNGHAHASNELARIKP